VVAVRQAGLEITDDRAEKARREQPRPERTGRVLTDWRQLSQSDFDRRGYMAKLPGDLLADSLGPVGGGQSSCLGGIPGGTKRMRAHMRDACGLPRGSGGGRCCGSLHVTGGASSDKSAADLFGDAQLATSEGPRPGDRLTRAAIPRSFRFEQSQHPLRAVRPPHRDGPPVSFAQRLRRTHTQILPRVSALGPPCRGSVAGRPSSTSRGAARAKSRRGSHALRLAATPAPSPPARRRSGPYRTARWSRSASSTGRNLLQRPSAPS
jgi:hypothetical protein